MISKLYLYEIKNNLKRVNYPRLRHLALKLCRYAFSWPTDHTFNLISIHIFRILSYWLNQLWKGLFMFTIIKCQGHHHTFLWGRRQSYINDPLWPHMTPFWPTMTPYDPLGTHTFLWGRRQSYIWPYMNPLGAHTFLWEKRQSYINDPLWTPLVPIHTGAKV